MSSSRDRHLRFRGGLVFQAHSISYHSTLGSRVTTEKNKKTPGRRSRRCVPQPPQPPQAATRIIPSRIAIRRNPVQKASEMTASGRDRHLIHQLNWYSSQSKNNHFAKMCCGNEAVSYSRLIDSCIAQRKAQGPSRTCDESKEEEERRVLKYGGQVTGAATTVFGCLAHPDLPSTGVPCL